MPTHRSRTGTPPTLPRRKPGAKPAKNKIAHAKATRGKASAPPMRAQTSLKPDPVVLEAAYRAFERLPRPRYLH